MKPEESGEGRVGEWVCEERNLYSDYQRLFGEPPPALSGVAVMTDTDRRIERPSPEFFWHWSMS